MAAHDERRLVDEETVNEGLVLTGVRVFDDGRGGFSAPQDILIRDERIVCVGRKRDATWNGVSEIDCTGKYALPGLFECHSHLAWLTTKDDETHRRSLRNFVSSGVTQVRDVGGPVEVLRAMRAKIESGDLIGPELFYAGPMLEKAPLHWGKFNRSLPGFTLAVNTRADAEATVRNLAAGGARLVKTFNKFDPDVFQHLVAQAMLHDLPVVHDPGAPFFSMIPIDRGIDCGVRCFEHATAPWDLVLVDEFEAEHDYLMRTPADERATEVFCQKMFELGLETVSRERLGEVIEKMVAAEAYLCPTLHVFRGPEDGAQGSADSAKLEAFREVSRFFVSEMIAGHVKMLVGHDGYDVESTFAEMGLLRACGHSEIEIIKGATRYPSQWLGVDSEYGALSAGYHANILVLEADPLQNIENIRSTYLVVKDGRPIFASH